MLYLFLVALTLFLALSLGYSFLLYLLHRKFPAHVRNDLTLQPYVSIIVATIAGGGLMEKKLDNLLSLDYSMDKVEIIVVDSSKHPFSIPEGVRVIHQEALGKPAALNQGIQVARNDIVVITDDDAVLNADALTRLTSYFSDPAIGGVVGDLTLAGKSFLNKMNTSFYSFFRNSTRKWESSLDTVSFTSGELFAFRKSLVSRINVKVLSDDLYLLFEIRKKHRRVVASDAKVFEEDVPSLLGQLQHKRRTMIGTLQVFSMNLQVLLNRQYGLFGMLIAPMYLLRITLCPILLALLEVLIVLIFPPLIFVIIFLFLGLIMLKKDLALALLYGFFIQIAAILGMVDFATKNYGIGWKKKSK